MGKPAILIPSPNVAENHQYHNAMALVNAGAADIIEEKDLTGAALMRKTDKMLLNPEKLEKYSENSRKNLFGSQKSSRTCVTVTFITLSHRIEGYSF